MKMIDETVSLWRCYICSRPLRAVAFVWTLALLTAMSAMDDMSVEFRMCCAGLIAGMIVCCGYSCRKFEKEFFSKTINKTVGCLLISMFVVSPWSLALADDSYAGYSGQGCYCLDGDISAASASDENDNVVVINFIVDQIEDAPSPLLIGAVPRIMSCRRPDPRTLVSWDKIVATFAANGVDINRSSSTQYAKNGQPTSESQVPFKFGGWSNPLTLYPNRKQYNVIVETASESGEFAQWHPVSQFSIPSGIPIQYQDTPDGSTAFYRIRIEPPYVQQQGTSQEAGAVLLGCGLGLLAGTGYVAIMAIRACSKNKKKFEDLKTNSSPSELRFIDASF